MVSKRRREEKTTHREHADSLTRSAIGDDLTDHVTTSAGLVLCHGVKAIKQFMRDAGGDDSISRELNHLLFFLPEALRRRGGR